MSKRLQNMRDAIEAEGPDEDDWITEDHRRFYSGGKLQCEVPDNPNASVWPHLRRCMERQSFYPNVWFQSDHGNLHLMVEERRRRRGR